MDDIITIAQKIENKIKELNNIRNQLFEKANNKAQSNSDYEKALAITLLKLKNGVITNFEGQEIKKLTCNNYERDCKRDRLQRIIC